MVNAVFDADDATVTDTAADPGPEYFHYSNRSLHGGDNSGGACGVVGSVTVTVQNDQNKTVVPDRSLVMSYFKGCSNIPNRYSQQQAERMRNALIDGNRLELVRVQLGETSYPGEVVAAVWDPNPNGQYMSYGHNFDTFRALFDQRTAQGFRLHSQQAYTKNGVTLYDHVWNPGDYPQDVIWGWTVADFAARHDQNVANGYYLHHLESYLLPDNHIRVNAIWNKTWGGVATTWVQGWAEADLAPKLTQMKTSGWRVRHLNAWNLPNNGDVRFDVVWEHLTWRDEVVRLNMTGAQVVQEYGTQWNRAFKFRTLDTFRIGNEQRYAGLWNPNTTGQLVLWGHTREQIVQQYDESWQQGWKIGSMAMVKF